MNYTQFINKTINSETSIAFEEGTSKAPHGDFITYALCKSWKLQLSLKALANILQYGVTIMTQPVGTLHSYIFAYRKKKPADWPPPQIGPPKKVGLSK